MSVSVSLDSGHADPHLHEWAGCALLAPQDKRDGLAAYDALAEKFELFERAARDGRARFEALADAAPDCRWRFATAEDLDDDHDADHVGTTVWDGQVAIPDGRDVAGAGEQGYPECSVTLVAEDDPDRVVTFQFRPSLPDAEHAERGDRNRGVPADSPPGVRVQVAQATNLCPEAALEVLRALVDTLGVDADVLGAFDPANLHARSRIFAAGQYVRVDCDIAERDLVGDGGLLERLAQFGSRRSGSGMYRWHNGETVGHRSEVDVDAVNARQFYQAGDAGEDDDAPHVALRNKVYKAANPPDDGPLAHPKFEVQWHKDRSDVTAVYWREEHAPEDELSFADIERELAEWLLNCLDWAGLPTVPDPEVFVGDAYWTPQPRASDDIEVRPDPLDAVREAHDDLATTTLASVEDTDSERAVLRALVECAPVDDLGTLAEHAGVSTSTASRALRERYDHLVERVDGAYELVSGIVSQKLQDTFAAVDRLRNQAASHASRAVDRIVSGASRAADELRDQSSPLGQWARRYVVELSETRQTLRRGERHALELVFESGEFSDGEIAKLLREGWHRAPADATADLEDAWVTYRRPGGEEVTRPAFIQKGSTLFARGLVPLH